MSKPTLEELFLETKNYVGRAIGAVLPLRDETRLGLAEKLNRRFLWSDVGQNDMFRIEIGRRPISLQELEDICMVLGFQPAALMDLARQLHNIEASGKSRGEILMEFQEQIIHEDWIASLK